MPVDCGQENRKILLFNLITSWLLTGKLFRINN